MSREFSFEDMPDEEIVMLSSGGDKAATEYLLGKYKNLVRAYARKYFLVGADRDDVLQEGMIGLFKAIRDYDSSRQSSFYNFACICVKHQLITAVKTSVRQKHVPLNSYVSLNKTVYDDESERILLDMLVEKKTVDPEEVFLRREKLEALNEKMERTLSAFEKEVITLYLDGVSYQEIAKRLGKKPKSIDNALQRVRRKLDI